MIVMFLPTGRMIVPAAVGEAVFVVAAVWEQQRVSRRADGRHHLAVAADVEEAFWGSFTVGASLEVARRNAGIARATAYRWWQKRFNALREQGVSVRAARGQLRVPTARANAWETERQYVLVARRREAGAAQRRAVRQSARHVEWLMAPRQRSRVEQRDTQYWKWSSPRSWCVRRSPHDPVMRL